MGNALCCRRGPVSGTTGGVKRGSSLHGSVTSIQAEGSVRSRSSFRLGRKRRSKDVEEVGVSASGEERGVDATTTRDVCKAQVVVNEDGHKEVNEFVLIKTIGKGTTGKVKLVLNRNDEQFYAIKQMNKRVLQRKRTFGMNNKLQDVQREVAIMRRLHHKNIVRLYQVIDDPNDDNLYLVMELLEGGSIQGDAIDGPIGELQAHHYFQDIVAGLEHLHAQKIIHRDLKPQNLLLTTDGVAKISDFGEAQEFEGENDTLTRTAGTPSFYSPELCSGTSEPRGRPSDVWALGVTLYCFVFGKVPFAGEHLMHLYETIKNDPVEIPAHCNPELADLIRRMLDKNPEARITIPLIKQHPWYLHAPAAPPVVIVEPAPEHQPMSAADVPDNMRFLSLSMGDTSQSRSMLEPTVQGHTNSRSLLPSSHSRSQSALRGSSSAFSYDPSSSKASSSSESSSEDRAFD